MSITEQVLTFNAEAGRVVGDGKEKASMKADEEKVKRNLEAYLKEHITSISFFNKAREVMVGKFKIEGPIVLTEGDYGDGFNYSVKSWANIETSIDENSSITKPMTFNLTIKVKGDDVIDIENNRINISDKF